MQHVHLLFCVIQSVEQDIYLVSTPQKSNDDDDVLHLYGFTCIHRSGCSSLHLFVESIFAICFRVKNGMNEFVYVCMRK